MTLIKETREIKAKNKLYPGYSKCSRCGGNWGWKKSKSHRVSEIRSLFLFCVECDKVVTLKERWKALDEWKKNCINQILTNSSIKKPSMLISDIENTEFTEFPRKDINKKEEIV